MKKFSKIFLILAVLSLVSSTLVLFAGCKDKIGLVNPKFEDGVFSWDSDSIVGKSVDVYSAVVNGVEKVVTASENGKRLCIDLKDEITKGNNFEVKIKAKGDNVKIDQTVSFTKLDSLNVEVLNGVFDWSASAANYNVNNGTVIYDVILDGERVASVMGTTYKVTTGVSHAIKVRPRVEGQGSYYFSDWSKEAVSTVLSAPVVSDVEWTVPRDAAGNALSASAEITWTSPAVTGQVEYEGTINGIEFQTTQPRLSTADVEGLDVKDGFAISITAKSKLEGVKDSAPSEVRRFISLAKVRNLSVSDGILYFDPVANAASYKIIGKDGATTIEVITETTSYKLNSAAESFNIVVVALPAGGYEAEENPSDAISFNILSKPGIRYLSRSFFIEGTIDNVQAYDIRIEKEVKVNGQIDREVVYEARQDVLNRIFNLYDFKEEGRYWISAKAIAKSGSHYRDSAYSDEYEVIRLGTVPGLKITEVPAIDNAGEKHSGYLRINLEKVENYAEYVTRYQLFMNNSEVSTTSKLQFDIPVPVTYDEAQYKFSIRTISDDDGSDTRVVLSSYYAVEFYAAKMSTPRQIVLQEDGKVSWTMPSPTLNYLQANGNPTAYNDTLADYQVVIAYTTYTVEADSNSFEFPATLSDGRYFINVYARSKYCKQNEAKRETVEMSFYVDENGKTVSRCYDHENSSVDLPKYTLDDKEYSVIVLSSDYSNTETMTRLETPNEDFFVIRDNILQWPAVQNAKGYDVYFATTVNGESQYGLLAHVEGTNFKIDDIENPADLARVKTLLAGTDGCVINIVAVGNRGKGLANGEVYSYDSRMSENHIIFKLDKPTGISVTDEYLSWNAVPNATGYRIYDGFTNSLLAYATRATSINITGFKNAYYNITIEAVGDEKRYFDSDRSDLFNFQVLDSMGLERYHDGRSGLIVYDNLYIWEPVEHALNYRITINGRTESVSADSERMILNIDGVEKEYYHYKPMFNVAAAEGILVEYQAVASNGLIIEDWDKYGYEDYDYPVVAGQKGNFRQIVKQVETPVFDSAKPVNFEIRSTYRRFYITANILTPPTVAGRECIYKYGIAGQSFYSVDKEFTYSEDGSDTFIQPGTYIVSVAYGANFFGDDNAYYIDSDFATTSQQFTFLRGTTRYAINPPIGGGANTDVTVTWDAIEGATTYRYFFEIYKAEKDKITGEMTILGTALYSSAVKTTEGAAATFTFNLGDALGESYENSAKYVIQISTVTIGNETDAISAYDVVLSEFSWINN